jgi:hypothetical protein
MAGIGRDLLDLPFAELVRNLAIAIADGQTALDRNSLETMRALVSTRVDLLTEITEIIEPEERVVVAGGQQILVTGAKITPSAAPVVPMSMFQAGLLPTFYQFTEASIEVRLSITMREDDQASSAVRSTQSGTAGLNAGFLGLSASRAYASTVDYRNANKYSYAAQGSSTLRATLRPVPPPSRFEPATTTINMFSQPPVVTRTPG